MKEEITNKQIWNDAARVGIVFGVFSSVCLGLKEAAALTGSTFLTMAASIILWAVEFFGCIMLMKKYIAEAKQHEGISQLQLYQIGRRVALLSGLILAAVNAVIVSLTPDETIEAAFSQAMSSVPANMQADAADSMNMMLSNFPIFIFIGQWLYCFLYGSVLSAIMSRNVFMLNLFNDAVNRTMQDGGDADDQSQPDEQ
jgi:hypothetical protein